MDNLRITLVQSSLEWENRHANLDHFSSLLKGLRGATDVAMLPETFTTGFSMNPAKLAEGMDGEAVAWMKRQAEAIGAVVCGSLLISEGGEYYNRLVWAEPSGELKWYNKRHRFSMGDEGVLSPGSDHPVFQYKGWRILPAVCYDLRFPVWLRRTAQKDYDLILLVANWPSMRIAHWDALLRARAIENQCFVAALNRIGADGNGRTHPGHSCVIGPKGEEICLCGEGPSVTTATINLNLAEAWRREFPIMQDADTFAVN